MQTLYDMTGGGVGRYVECSGCGRRMLVPPGWGGRCPECGLQLLDMGPGRRPRFADAAELVGTELDLARAEGRRWGRPAAALGDRAIGAELLGLGYDPAPGEGPAGGRRWVKRMGGGWRFSADAAGDGVVWSVSDPDGTLFASPPVDPGEIEALEAAATSRLESARAAAEKWAKARRRTIESRRWDGWTMSFSLAPEATTLRLPESDEITLSLDGRWGSVRPRLSIDVDGLRLSGELAGA